METLARSDLFFLITGTAVIVLSLALLALIIYVTHLVRELKDIVRIVKRETELISDDIAELRDRVAVEGVKISSFWLFIRKLWGIRSSRRGRRTKGEGEK